MRKINCKKEKIVWQQIQWLRYDNVNRGEILYKNSLNESDDYTKKRLILYEKVMSQLLLKKSYAWNTKNLLQFHKKNKDLIDMLSLLSPANHEFYHNLKSDDKPCIDPDVELLDSGLESINVDSKSISNEKPDKKNKKCEQIKKTDSNEKECKKINKKKDKKRKKKKIEIPNKKKKWKKMKK